MAQVAQAANAGSINLSAGGHRIGVDKGRFEWLAENDVRGWECNYFAWGGAACMVEVDTLTGEVTLLSADIVLDAGASINPAVDAGQVEGGFIQSVGWVLKEELLWGDRRDSRSWIPPGMLHTDGVATYRIPALHDVPRAMNVS